MFEIALSCGLLVAAGLMIKSVAKLRNMDPGFTTKDVFTARVGFPAAYTDTIAQWRFFDEVAAERVSALPGVQVGVGELGAPGRAAGFRRQHLRASKGRRYLKDKDYPERALAVGDARLLRHAQDARRRRSRLHRSATAPARCRS